MTYLAVGPFLPPPHGSLGTGDWIVVIVTIAIFAIAVTAMLVFGNRRSELKPKVEQPPVEHRKAA